MICNGHPIKYTEPRTITIRRVVEEFLRETATAEDTFADNVKEQYHALVPNPKRRTLKFHETDDVSADMEANGQLLGRCLRKDSVRFPADLEEAVVAALPPQYRFPLMRELAARYGLLAVPIPEANNTTHTATQLQKLMDGFGKSVEALAPVVADGVVDANDRKAAKAALPKLEQLLAEAEYWRQALVGVVLEHEED